MPNPPGQFPTRCFGYRAFELVSSSEIRISSPPHFPQKTDEIAARNQFDVGLLVSARGQHRRNAAEVCDRVEVGRGLLAAECAVEIGTDPGMTRVAGDLADVIDVIHDSFEFQA